MAFELQSEQVFERQCTGLGLATYSPTGEIEGIYKDWLLPRKLVCFERLIYAMFAEEQVEAFIRRIVLKPSMSAEDLLHLIGEIEKRQNSDAKACLNLLKAIGESST